MKAELYPEIAPNTVNNFISLVKKGFYDGLKMCIRDRLVDTGFQVLFHSPPGVLFTFPSQYYALSVTK